MIIVYMNKMIDRKLTTNHYFNVLDSPSFGLLSSNLVVVFDHFVCIALREVYLIVSDQIKLLK